MTAAGNDAFSDVTLAILAGGEGSRMGIPKGQLILDGRPILDYLLDHFNWPGATLLVTAPGREHPPGWRRFSKEVSDPHAGGGPLRGILTALEHLQTPLLLVVTVDMPGVRLVHCKKLLDGFRCQPLAPGAMMQRKVNGNPQVEPFPFVLRSSARDRISQRLAAQRRSVHALLEEPGFLAVDSPPDWSQEVWMNLNSPEDVASFRRKS
jgi:molybdopterin-guanine dinucleotide biosynthesis protein A